MYIYFKENVIERSSAICGKRNYEHFKPKLRGLTPPMGSTKFSAWLDSENAKCDDINDPRKRAIGNFFEKENGFVIQVAILTPLRPKSLLHDKGSYLINLSHSTIDTTIEDKKLYIGEITFRNICGIDTVDIENLKRLRNCLEMKLLRFRMAVIETIDEHISSIYLGHLLSDSLNWEDYPLDYAQLYTPNNITLPHIASLSNVVDRCSQYVESCPPKEFYKGKR